MSFLGRVVPTEYTLMLTDQEGDKPDNVVDRRGEFDCDCRHEAHDELAEEWRGYWLVMLMASHVAQGLSLTHGHKVKKREARLARWKMHQSSQTLFYFFRPTVKKRGRIRRLHSKTHRKGLCIVSNILSGPRNIIYDAVNFLERIVVFVALD